MQALPSGCGVHLPFLQAWHSVQPRHFFFFFFLAPASPPIPTPATPTAASRPRLLRRERDPAKRVVKASKRSDSNDFSRMHPTEPYADDISRDQETHQ